MQVPGDVRRRAAPYLGEARPGVDVDDRDLLSGSNDRVAAKHLESEGGCRGRRGRGEILRIEGQALDLIRVVIEPREPTSGTYAVEFNEIARQMRLDHNV